MQTKLKRNGRRGVCASEYKTVRPKATGSLKRQQINGHFKILLLKMKTK